MEQPTTPKMEEGNNLEDKIKKTTSDLDKIIEEIAEAKNNGNSVRYTALQKVHNTLSEELLQLNTEKARQNLEDIKATSKKTQAELDEQYKVRNRPHGVVDWDAQGYDATKKRA